LYNLFLFFQFSKNCSQRWLIASLQDTSRLEEELKVCQEVQSEEMELSPLESKWPALTEAHLRQRIGGEARAAIPNILQQLQQADPLRYHYYDYLLKQSHSEKITDPCP
jgi:hypothetical protein